MWGHRDNACPRIHQNGYGIGRGYCQSLANCHRQRYPQHYEAQKKPSQTYLRYGRSKNKVK
jgi:hypothetical protein